MRSSLRRTIAWSTLLPLTVFVACATPRHSGDHAVALEGTYWQVIRLHDSAVAQVPPPRGAHLMLDPDSHHVSGSGGCNRLVGTYQVTEKRLSLGPLAMTRMACVDGMEAEAAFVAALARVKGWTIAANQLALADSAGKTVALFEARDTSQAH